MATMVLNICHTSQEGFDEIPFAVRCHLFDSIIEWFDQHLEMLSPEVKIMVVSRDEYGPIEFMVSDDGEINFTAVLDPTNMFVVMKFHVVPIAFICSATTWLVDNGWREHRSIPHHKCVWPKGSVL